MVMLLLISAYLVASAVLGIVAGKVTVRRDAWQPARPGRALTRASRPPNERRRSRVGA